MITRLWRLPVPALFVVVMLAPAAAQQKNLEGNAPNGRSDASRVIVSPEYVIGPGDVLSIVFWRDKDLTTEAKVRPDGRISVPLLNEIQAAGLTPEELRLRLTEGAAKFVQEPTASVVVREINSRNVFITGNVAKPGSYVLHTRMNVLQLIAQAGGLVEFADSGGIRIIRNEAGGQEFLTFNYKDVVKGKRLEQNIWLRPGDTVIVP